MKVLDLNTAEGLIEHFRSLPTANLKAIAARQMWAGNVAEIVTAEAILTERGE